MNDDTPPPPAGHNQPTAEELQQQDLARANKDMIDRTTVLLDSFNKVPAECKDENTAIKMTDLVTLINAAITELEARRTSAKAPFLLGGRIVDGFFNARMITGLVQAKETIVSRRRPYLQEKEKLAREAAEKAERDARAEADRLANEAVKKNSDAAMHEAVTAENVAVEHGKRAAAPAAQLSRVRGDFGGTAGLRNHLLCRIDDREKLDLQKLRPYLALDCLQKALNAAGRAGLRDVAGATIKDEKI